MIPQDREEKWNKILFFCNYRERCEKEVLKKIQSLELPPLIEEEFMDDLIRLKMVDNLRFAKAFASGKFKLKHWGKNKIRQALMMNNIQSSHIGKALSDINMDEYLKEMDRLISQKQRHLKGKTPQERNAKIYRFLYYKGYEAELIHQRLGNMDD